MRLIVGIAAVVILLVGAIILWRSHREDPAWAAYRVRFVQADGRVVDTGNKNVSHTEGQGYAMLFAVANNDPATFDPVWTWTRDTLRRPDGLFSWRYAPGETNPIADKNNATDGDLMICWALLQAARLWDRPDYHDAALTLANAIKSNLIINEDGDAYLLPGVDGFTGDDKRVLNLSYWIFPALQQLSTETHEPIWQQTIATGLRLLETARFGEHRLPTDWIETSGELRPAETFPPHFGYDAVRIPLYVIWANLATPARTDAMAQFWAHNDVAWINVTNGQLSSEKQSPGMAAIARLTQRSSPIKMPTKADIESGDYYNASLLMLAGLAERQRARK